MDSTEDYDDDVEEESTEVEKKVEEVAGTVEEGTESVRSTTEEGKAKSGEDIGQGSSSDEDVEMSSNEGDVEEEEEKVGNLRVGNLKRDPGLSDEVESYTTEAGIKASGKSVIPCKSPLVLKISHNKNLVAIEEGTFQDVDVCEVSGKQ